MSKIEILFTESTIAEMTRRNAKVPEGFTGPVFESAELSILDSFVVVTTDISGPNGQPPAIYMYPALAVARIKISD